MPTVIQVLNVYLSKLDTKWMFIKWGWSFHILGENKEDSKSTRNKVEEKLIACAQAADADTLAVQVDATTYQGMWDAVLV